MKDRKQGKESLTKFVSLIAFCFFSLCLPVKLFQIDVASSLWSQHHWMPSLSGARMAAGRLVLSMLLFWFVFPAHWQDGRVHCYYVPCLFFFFFHPHSPPSFPLVKPDGLG
jgi:hypothetical protein